MTPRPWRLTRRQRVEMEAALASIRSPLVVRAASLLSATSAAGWTPLVSDHFPDGMHEWRILRARVAIALRAALRADEDARCEVDILRWESGLIERYEIAYVLREWPELRRGENDRVPLALWEVGR